MAWAHAQTPAGAGDCWVTDRLEYRFSVAADTDAGEVVLAAPEYLGGRLDWYDLDVDPTRRTRWAPRPPTASAARPSTCCPRA